ncbi:tumor necrosis factor ligand superfamily member 13 isoform X2 [Ascaphus truei]|uniref:tumor necrosis factor ligand superfamily member 13 isoform X2 n=1 Tax=Ascaphus truei TaxID=8439 RepID=UPI003F5ADA31
MPASGSWHLAQGLWGGTGAWLGVIGCLIALLGQSIHLGNLQRELSLMQQRKDEPRLEVKKYRSAGEDVLTLWPRERRDLEAGRNQKHKGKRSFLHVIPESLSSDESRDATEVSWKVSLQVGDSLEVRGASVRVKDSGIYSIYSQVLYEDTTFTMGHVVTRGAGGDAGDGELLFRCVKSMPRTESLAYNTCYSAGVFRLRKGDTISLVIPRFNVSLDARGHATFLGLIRLCRDV